MDMRSDHELLAACRTGEQAALAVLVARHQDLVHRACRRQAPPGDVEDCVQAVFVVLARRPAAAAGAVALAPWLLRVAWHVSNRARRAGDRRRRAEAAAAAIDGRRQDAPADEASAYLDDCLNRLPEKQRAAVCLRFLSSLSPEDVAVRLGTSRANAYKLINRGLAAMRDQLARHGVPATGAALGCLLASEAQTAGTPPSSPPIEPTAKATALAQETMTAMKISAFLPLAGVAGLLAAAGTATLLLTAEPATPPATPPQPAAKQAPVAPPAAQPMDLSGGWNATDTKMTSNELAQQILRHPWLESFAKQQGRSPVVRLAGFVVRGDGEAISVQAIIDGMRYALDPASDRIRLLADAAAPAAGMAVAADATFSGSLTIEVGNEGGNRTRRYTVTITGADPSGVQVVSVQCVIRKEIAQNAFR